MGEPVAVVGLGCVLPDAHGVQVFWDNLLRGHAAIRPLRGGVWDWTRYVDADPGTPDKAYALLAARIEDYAFDWRRFRMPPAEVDAINPLQLMVLDAGTQALEPLKAIPRDRAGLFLGATGLGWQRDSGLRIRLGDWLEALEQSPAFARLAAAQRRAVMEEAQRLLDARLKPVSEDNVVGASASVAAGRIAMHFDLKGLHYAVDAGYASSLAALDVGVRALRDGTLDLAVVGGVSELLNPLELVAFSKLGGMGRTRVAPFDAAAEGTLMGEGVVVFALKRLADAVRDGETIHAVVLGVGGSSDGYGKALVAPHAEGQARALRRAYDDAEASPSTVGFVECHATGTQLGDATEVRSLTSVYGPGPAGSVALGSAKAFVGHLRGAAGAVGMLRAVLALSQRTVPAQVGFQTPNPALELERTPFFVPTQPVRLEPRGGAEAPRAAVSSFGFGGNNFHAVLEAHVPGRPRRARPAPPPVEPVAIVGMGGMFPGADNVPAFWQLLMDGRDTTREVPAERWDINRHWDADPNRLDTSYSRVGCFLERLPEADRRWRIPPSALASVDPSQLLVLRCAEEALADAGYTPDRWDRDRVGVMLAFLPYQGKKFLADIRVNSEEYATALRAALGQAGMDAAQVDAVVAETEARFKQGLPPVTEDTLTGYLGSLNAGRITKLFDFHGPHLVVDSACASTHAALHAAIQALRHRTCDVVLSGGVWSDMMPEFFIAACRFNALSATGIRPFGEGADGFVPGEGAGIFVLKRLTDAERDGDRIHAVIRAVAGSSDGRGRSVLAPNPAGEALAMRRALDDAGVDPTSVDYVECHGTGTALGDVVEVDALTRAYGTGRPQPLRIGSAKSNIGHLNAAAGAAALVKAALAVRDGVIPASLKADRPNPQIDFASGPITVVTRNERWETAAGQPRRAGVSGFGVGGTNMHLVVEQYLPGVTGRGPSVHHAQTGPESPSGPQVALAAATDLQRCVQALGALAQSVKGADERSFADAVAASHGAPPEGADRVRVAIVARSADELWRRQAVLEGAVRKGHDLALLRQQGVCVGMLDPSLRVAVMFPGQGPQYVNMLRDAAARFPRLRQTLNRVDEAYTRLSGRPLTPAFMVEDAAGWQQRDEDIHCAVFAVNCALHDLLRAHGLRADAFIGQSAGELSALVAAGALSLEDGLLAVRERTLSVLALQAEDPGQMVALTCSAQEAAKLVDGLPGYAALAADNAPSACIVSGARPAMAALVERCAQQGIDATVLAVSHAYHSQMIAGARDRYLAVLRTLTFRPAECDVFSTITGASLTGMAPADLPELLASQFVLPVALRQAVDAAYASGVRLFVECGPKWPLTTFTDEILAGRPHASLPTIHPKVGEVEMLQRALAFLHVHGCATLEPGHVVQSPAATKVTAAPVPSLPPLPAAGPARSLPPPSADVLSLLTSIRDLIDGYLAASVAPVAASAAPVAASAANVQVLERRSAPPRLAPSVPAPAPARPAATVDVDSMLVRLKAQALKKTGYPDEMLEPDLDLEADLGIDTVKQVAILGEVRTALGLPPDKTFKLREHNTLRKMAAYLARRVGEHAAPPPAPARPAPARPAPASPSRSGAPRQELHNRLVVQITKKTGYPAEMLEPDLDLEADLGIDTVKQVAIVGEVRAALGLPVDPAFKLRTCNTINKVVDYLLRRLESAGPAPAAVTPPPPPPAHPGPVAASAAPVGQDAQAAMLAKLRAAVVKKTAYPEEMLEPDLDLEADLGIDTVKQVAVLGEVRASLGLQPDKSFKLREHNTLRKMAAYLAARVDAAQPAPAAPPPVVAAVPPAPPPAEPAADTFAHVHRLVVAQVTKKTGYPAEMLELDLDMEADLGIDTVKQVAILGEVRAALGLPPDKAFKLREHNTLRKAITHLAGRVQPALAVAVVAPEPPPLLAPVPTPGAFQSAGEPVFITSRAPGTAYVCGGAELRVVTPARCVQLMVAAAQRAGGGAPPVALRRLRAGAPALVDDAGSLRLEAQVRPEGADLFQARVVSSAETVHLQGLVQLRGAGESPPPWPAPASVRAAVDPRGRPLNGVALLDAVGRGEPSSRPLALTWAHATQFDVLAGGLTVPPTADTPAAVLAAVLDGAALLTGFGWYALTGVFHALASLEELRVLSLPAAGAELAVHAQLGPQVGGLWRGNVLVLDDAGRVVVELDGLGGVRVGPTAGAVWQGLDIDGTAVGWQRFCQRLAGPVVDGEDRSW